MRKSDIQREFLGYGVLYLDYLDQRKREATEAIAKLQRDEGKAAKKAEKAAGKAAKKARKRPVDDIMTDDAVSSTAESGDASAYDVPFDPDEAMVTGDMHDDDDEINEVDDDDPDTPPEVAMTAAVDVTERPQQHIDESRDAAQDIDTEINGWS